MKKRSDNTVVDGLTFGGKKPTVVQVEAEEPQMVVLQNSANQFLAIAWDIDATGKGFWRIQQIGVERGKIATKQYRPGEVKPAFYGEISVIGAGRNDLFTSFGYEDADIRDAEGNLKNKAQEIVIRPKQRE